MFDAPVAWGVVAQNKQTDVDPAGTERTGGETAKDFSALTYMISYAAAGALALVANLIDFAIRLGDGIINMQAVQDGWQIVLTLANLGFVLAVIVIAFATMFNQQSYAMKNTLWKLVIAALLVNFSLVIGGAIISVSNVVSNTFLEATTFTNLSNALGQAIQPQTLSALQLPQSGTSTVAVATRWFSTDYWLGKMLSYFSSLLFGLVFTVVSVLVFLALFVMLLIRAIALAILLIVSPLAWLAWIFPYTSEWWDKWWKQFIHWNLFAPAVLFFIYLAILTAASFPQGYPGAAGDAAKAALNSTVLAPSMFDHLAKQILILGILVGGLFAGNAFSIMGSKAAFGAAKGGAVGFKNWAGRKGIRGAGLVFSNKRFNAALQGASQNLQQEAKQRSWYNPRKYSSLVAGAGLAGAAKLGRLKRGEKYQGETKHAGFFKSLTGGIQGGSGLFAKRKEKKETTQKELDRLYTRKTALQQERDYISRLAAPTQDEQDRLNELISKLIPDLDKKIKEKEAQVT